MQYYFQYTIANLTSTINLQMDFSIKLDLAIRTWHSSQ